MSLFHEMDTKTSHFIFHNKLRKISNILHKNKAIFKTLVNIIATLILVCFVAVVSQKISIFNLFLQKITHLDRKRPS